MFGMKAKEAKTVTTMTATEEMDKAISGAEVYVNDLLDKTDALKKAHSEWRASLAALMTTQQAEEVATAAVSAPDPAPTS